MLYYLSSAEFGSSDVCDSALYAGRNETLGLKSIASIPCKMDVEEA
jgi:hypothetical protein